MKPDLQALLDKVNKLRALAARAGTLGEAEAAAAQADAIIAKYRLDEAELEAAGEADPESAAAHEDPLEVFHLRRYQPWAGMLAAGLAKHYGCYVYRRWGDGMSTLPVFGRASDVAILRLVYAWARTEITRLSKCEHGVAAKRAFCIGAAIAFTEVLRQSTEIAQAQHHSGSAALVLVSRRQEAERLARSQVRLTKGSSTPTRDNGAFERGKAAGGSMNVGDRALGGQSVKRLKA